MERIESAINKARLARKSRVEVADRLLTGQSGAVPQPEPAQTSAVAAWAGLMEFRPDAKQLERNRIVAMTAGPGATPFDGMRTRLLYLMRDKGWKRVAITSPGPGCGKTTVSLNLALSLSRMEDERTVLVDADLRRPAVGLALGASAGHQFSNVLTGTAPASQNMLRIGANLAIGTNKTSAANSAELLQNPIAREALDRIEREFHPTLIIVDLPPVLVSDDAMAALSLVDCVLIVAATEATTIQEIDRCEQQLAQRTSVAGVILNKCRYLEKGEGYGYEYY